MKVCAIGTGKRWPGHVEVKARAFVDGVEIRHAQAADTEAGWVFGAKSDDGVHIQMAGDEVVEDTVLGNVTLEML